MNIPAFIASFQVDNLKEIKIENSALIINWFRGALIWAPMMLRGEQALGGKTDIFNTVLALVKSQTCTNKVLVNPKI